MEFTIKRAKVATNIWHKRNSPYSESQWSEEQKAWIVELNTLEDLIKLIDSDEVHSNSIIMTNSHICLYDDYVE